MYTYMYIRLQAHAYQDMNVEIRRQLAGGSFPLWCESQRLDSGRQAWQQVSLPAEPSS